jgi:hypothetical protein
LHGTIFRSRANVSSRPANYAAVVFDSIIS